jgi:hypothetical protein
VKVASGRHGGLFDGTLAVIVPDRSALPAPAEQDPSEAPRIPDMAPASPAAGIKPGPALHTVTAVMPDCRLVLETGASVSFLGLQILDHAAARTYLLERVLKKQVFLKDERAGEGSSLSARVILKNRISINSQLLKSGAARAVDQQGR